MSTGEPWRRREVLQGVAASLAASMAPLGAAVCASRSSVATQRAPTPDLILHNAAVYTVDAGDSVAAAVAVAGDRIIAVGTSTDVLALAGAATRKIDLAGKTVTPGFIDGHPHMDDVGMSLLRTRWGRVDSIEDVQRVVRRETAKLERGAWLMMPSLAATPDLYRYPGALAEGRWPDRRDLDRASPDNPVYIECHPMAPPGVAMLNTAALHIAGIDRNYRAPDGVEIERDENGEPTGVVVDYNYPRVAPLYYWSLRREPFLRFPTRPLQDVERAVRAGMQAFNAAGVTSIYEGHGLPPEAQQAYLNLRLRDELSVRTYFVVSFPFPAYDNPQLADDIIARTSLYAAGNGFGDDYLKFGGLGFSVDSAAAAGAAFMRQPYVNPQGRSWRGVQLAPDEGLRAALFKAARANLRVQVQCSGGAAIDKVLSLYEEIDREIPLRGKRWTIEHCQFPSAQNMATCRRLGIVPTSCVSFLWDYGSVYLRCFGEQIADGAIPFRSWLEAGVPIVHSTDGHPFEPMRAFWQMLARRDGFSGRVMGPSQRISRAQALRAYTMNGAYAAFWENQLGSIEAGKLADLVVLSDDIMTIAEDRIPETKVLATLVGGRVVHDAGMFA